MPVQTFRKKPVETQAVQWTGDNIHELWDWAGADNVYGPTEMNPLRLYVAANDAWLDLEVGEWILRDARGFYPCKPDIFADTYEPATLPRRGCGPDCSERHTYGAGCAIKPPARAFLGEPPCGKPGCPCGSAR